MSSKRKKLLFILNNNQHHGANNYGLQIAYYIQNDLSSKLEVTLHFARNDISKISIQPLLNATSFSFNSSHDFVFAKILSKFKYYLNFIIYIATNRPNIIYSNTITNNFEVIVSKLFGAKTIVHVHEGYSSINHYKLGLNLSKYFTDTYISVSDYSNNCMEQIIGVNCCVIKNGVSIIPLSRNCRVEDHDCILGIVGTIDSNKRQDILVLALDRLIKSGKINYKVHIYGSISDSKFYKQLLLLIYNLNLNEHVKFMGVNLDKSAIYSNIDILISCSEDEAFPLVTLEAMISKIPVIASKTGGNIEIIGDCNGFLYDNGNVTSLLNQILMIENSPEVVKKAVATAYKNTIKLYSATEQLHKCCKVVEMISY